MKNSTKFLGIMIDRYLDFNEHIQYIKGKISRGLGILFKCRNLFTHKTLLTLYNSFLYPYINYCITVWGSTLYSYLAPLVKLQKRAIRVIAGKKRYSNTDPIFRKLKIMKFKQIYLYSVQLFMFKFHHNKLPGIFENYFTRNRSYHTHDTRANAMFRPPLVRSAMNKRIIRVIGVRTYNYFAPRLNIDCSYLSYKVALRTFLIMNDLTSIDEFI